MNDIEEKAIKKEWEIIHKYLNRAALVVVAMFMIVIAGLFIFKINSAAVAPGQVVLSSNKRTIQHLEGGIIKEILVRNGDLVKQGQALIILSNTQSKENIKAAHYQLYSLQAEVDRLNLQLQNGQFIEAEFLKKYPQEIVSLEHSNYLSKTKAYLDNSETISGNFEEAKLKLILFEREKNIIMEKLQLLEQEKETMEYLYQTKNTTRTRYLEALRQLQEARLSLIKNRSDLQQTLNTKKELEIKLRNHLNEYQGEINSRLVQASREMSEIDKQYKNFIDVDERLTVTSPVEGYVRNMQVFTVGGVFRTGQDLMDIVPKDEELLIEVKIEPKDRDIVKINQEVMVNLSSLQSKIIPRLEGRLTYVDFDITKEQSGKSY